MICAYTGFVPEEELLNMSYVMYTNILSEITRKQQYEAVTNLYGNSFVSDAFEKVEKYNPLSDLTGGGSEKPQRLTREAIEALKGINRV